MTMTLERANELLGKGAISNADRLEARKVVQADEDRQAQDKSTAVAQGREKTRQEEQTKDDKIKTLEAEVKELKEDLKASEALTQAEQDMRLKVEKAFEDSKFSQTAASAKTPEGKK